MIARTSLPTTLEFALLGLLRAKAQSGYDLRKTFASTPMGHYSDSPGSIYPALRRLEARHWISGSPTRRSPRRQHVYRITAAGRKALLDWLKMPVSREDVIWNRDQLMLRFAFLDGNVPRSAADVFLAGLEREVGSYVRELRDYARQSGLLETLSTGGLAFSFGVASYDALFAWVRRARRQLSGEIE